LCKLGAFGYGPTTSIKSGQMRKAPFSLGEIKNIYTNWKHWGKVHQPNKKFGNL